MSRQSNGPDDRYARRPGPGRPRHPDILTPAEWRVLELVREGLSNGEIATRLDVSVNTVRTHVSRILAKTGAEDRVALASWPGEPREATRSILEQLRAVAPLPWLRWGATSWVAGTVLVGALGVLAVVVIGNLADSDGGKDDESRPMASSQVITATVVALATAPPTATTVPRPVNVVWIVEAATADYTEVYRGEDGRVQHWQRLAPDGTGFWVGHYSEGHSVRYDWDGVEQERLDAPIGVVESPSGEWRGYDVIVGDQVSAVVEGDVARFEIDGRAWNLVFEPDETRVAFMHWHDVAGQMLALSMLDLATGEQTVLAGPIGPCECDGGPTPTWSPSGRYLAYMDHGGYPPNASGERPGRGVFVVDTVSGDVRELLPVEGEELGLHGWAVDEDVILARRALWFETNVSRGYRPEPYLTLVDPVTGEFIGERELPAVPTEDGVFQSPDGKREAAIRGLRSEPTSGITTWEIALRDVASDVTTIVGEIEGERPHITWNDVGTHFVVHNAPDL